jgi:hypothetical protein
VEKKSKLKSGRRPGARKNGVHKCGSKEEASGREFEGEEEAKKKVKRKQNLNCREKEGNCREKDEVVLSYWNAPAHGNKFRLKEATLPESCPKPIENTHFREEPCSTAVSKLHGRAPNPRTASARGDRAVRGGWRLPVFGEHFYDFWKINWSFPG